MKYAKLLPIALLAFGLIAASQPVLPPPTGKVKPAGVPLELNIIPPKKGVKLNLGGKTAAEYRKSLQVLSDMKLPKQPEVGFQVELKNTSKQELQVWTAGDPAVLSLDVNGPGVVNILAQRMFTLDFRAGKAVKIPAGGTHTFLLPTLEYGFRGSERRTYLTEAGEIVMTAILKTAVNPAPPIAKDARDGFGFVTVTSAPIKLTVAEK